VAEQVGQQYVPAVGKAFAILELLAERGPMTLAQVERASGLNRTMSYRLLRVMDELDYVEHDPARHHYKLGVRLLGLGAAVGNRLDLAKLAWPFLDTVREETQEAIALGVLAGNEVVYLGVLESPRGGTTTARIGSRGPVHATSVGKAILAYLPDDERGRLLESLGQLTPVTASTLVDPEHFALDLKRTRDRGYALDDEEHETGARGIGVPVLDAHDHPVAAVALEGPADRIDFSRADRTAAQLWWASREMSRRMGHAPEEIAS
jgi:DNA-binding IclR family transcriptional regulator